MEPSSLDQIEAGQRRMLLGAAWFGGGFVVTFVTRAMAAGGGTYIVAWGAMLFGSIQFLLGLALALERHLPEALGARLRSALTSDLTQIGGDDASRIATPSPSGIFAKSFILTFVFATAVSYFYYEAWSLKVVWAGLLYGAVLALPITLAFLVVSTRELFGYLRAVARSLL